MFFLITNLVPNLIIIKFTDKDYLFPEAKSQPLCRRKEDIMSQERREILGAKGPSISPEMIARGLVRGRQLQAEAIRSAFMSLFGKAEDKRPSGSQVSHGGLARACAKVIP